MLKICLLVDFKSCSFAVAFKSYDTLDEATYGRLDALRFRARIRSTELYTLHQEI